MTSFINFDFEFLTSSVLILLFGGQTGIVAVTFSVSLTVSARMLQWEYWSGNGRTWRS